MVSIQKGNGGGDAPMGVRDFMSITSWNPILLIRYPSYDVIMNRFVKLASCSCRSVKELISSSLWMFLAVVLLKGVARFLYLRNSFSEHPLEQPFCTTYRSCVFSIILAALAIISCSKHYRWWVAPTIMPVSSLSEYLLINIARVPPQGKSIQWFTSFRTTVS